VPLRAVTRARFSKPSRRTDLFTLQNGGFIAGLLHLAFLLLRASWVAFHGGNAGEGSAPAVLFAPGTAAVAASASCCCFAGSLASPLPALQRRREGQAWAGCAKELVFPSVFKTGCKFK